jgi:copper(I)-binding protein
VANQSATGAFMKLTAPAATRLVEVRSPVAGIVEVHEMKLDGDVMRMRAVPALPLPAGQMVELKPGGYHVMLMDLKGPVKAGDAVPLTLVFEGADGKRLTQDVKATARALAAPAPAAAGGHGSGHGAGHKH